jgi:hypothetical protein
MDFSGKYNNLSGIFHHFPDKKTAAPWGAAVFLLLLTINA